MSDCDLIRSALQDAIGWQQGLADAYAHIPDAPERAEALKQANAYRGLLKRRYGSRKTDVERHLDRELANSKPVGLKELMAMAAEPGIPNCAQGEECSDPGSRYCRCYRGAGHKKKDGSER